MKLIDNDYIKKHITKRKGELSYEKCGLITREDLTNQLDLI